MYHTTETAQQADLVLPAAGWGEKEGTFINSERRVGVIKRVAKRRASAGRFLDLQADRRALGLRTMFSEWSSPAAVFQILKRLSAGQPCDFSGIVDYRMIEERGGIQWPYPIGAADRATERRLFADGRFYHADGRARFIFESPRPLREPPGKNYPFLLLTGRGSVAQWHTQTRTGKSAVLRKLYPQDVYVEINPDDARRINIRSNQWIRVESQRGSIRAKTFVTPTIQPGHVFLPMHYETVNQLTHAVFDPYSKQPSYKACRLAFVRISSNEQGKERPRSQALPGTALPARLRRARASRTTSRVVTARRSLADSTFPGRAWEREYLAVFNTTN